MGEENFRMHLNKIVSLFLYGFSSFAITVVNKVVLTSYGFPSYAFLGVCQMVFIVCLIAGLHCIRVLKIVSLTRAGFAKIAPLPVLYLLNLFFGLGGTKELSLPMFVVLRRFSILFTMILEYLWLREQPSIYIQLSVFVMIFGSLVAAVYDLGFNLVAYFLVFVNDVATAANNVLIKAKLLNKDIDKQSLVFYNCLLGIAPLLLWTFYTNEIFVAADYDKWFDMNFVASFVLSCSSAYLLMISTTWCIEANGALTVTIVGVVKNSVVTYLGMFIGGDYIFNWPNFTGVTISMLGAVIYTVANTRSKKSQPRQAPNPSVKSEKLGDFQHLNVHSS